MTLTNPTSFLQKVDKEVYGVLTQKNLSQKQSELSGLIYTEPRISTPFDGSGLVGSSKSNQAMETTEWTISSKVQTLGDFIDTDAVSLAAIIKEKLATDTKRLYPQNTSSEAQPMKT